MASREPLERSPEEVEVDRVEMEVKEAAEPSPVKRFRPASEFDKLETAEQTFAPTLKSKYRFEYYDPERLAPSEARRRRFESALEKARSRLYQGVISKGFDPRWMGVGIGLSNERSPFGRGARAEFDVRPKAAAADRRLFHPLGDFASPRTLFGAEAESFVVYGFKGQFKHALQAIPCVQRLVRKEVMFAKRKAGRGYRVPHVRSILSSIGC